MRNLEEYPITREELSEFMDQIARDVDPEKTGLIGDLRPLMIREIAAIVWLYMERHPEYGKPQEKGPERGPLAD